MIIDVIMVFKYKIKDTYINRYNGNVKIYDNNMTCIHNGIIIDLCSIIQLILIFIFNHYSKFRIMFQK